MCGAGMFGNVCSAVDCARPGVHTLKQETNLTTHFSNDVLDQAFGNLNGSFDVVPKTLITRLL